MPTAKKPKKTATKASDVAGKAAKKKTAEGATNAATTKGNAAKTAANASAAPRPLTTPGKAVGERSATRGARKSVATTSGAAKRTRTKAGRPTTVADATRSAAPKRAKRVAKPAPAYLAVELGTPVDPQGEPIGAGSPRAEDDRELQEYALQLWRQMQRGSVTKRYMRSMERAGLTLDEVWAVGLREVWTTSSSADEMRRYRQKMLFRANLLEAILAETVADLRRLEGIDAHDAARETPDMTPTASQIAQS